MQNAPFSIGKRRVTTGQPAISLRAARLQHSPRSALVAGDRDPGDQASSTEGGAIVLAGSDAPVVHALHLRSGKTEVAQLEVGPGDLG